MRRMQYGILSGFIGAGVVFFSTVGCEEEPENAYIMSQMHMIAADSDEAPAGFMCTDVSAGGGSSSGGDEANDFWMREESSSAGLSVQIGSFDEVLESRFYDRAFIVAHDVDRFVVTMRSGDQYAFVYWGGDSCEPCPPGPFEFLPGDPWGCDSGGDGAEPPVPAVD